MNVRRTITRTKGRKGEKQYLGNPRRLTPIDIPREKVKYKPREIINE